MRLDISAQRRLVIGRIRAHSSIIRIEIRAKSRLASLDRTHGLLAETLRPLMELLHLQLLTDCLINVRGCSGLLQFLEFLNVTQLFSQFHSVCRCQLTGLLLLELVDGGWLD